MTPAAKSYIQDLINQRSKPPAGIEVGVKTRGCSGLSYFLEYVDQPREHMQQQKFDDFVVFIDAKSMMFLIGTEIDYEQNDLEEGLVFKNPKERGRCGCGESFHI